MKVREECSRQENRDDVEGRESHSERLEHILHGRGKVRAKDGRRAAASCVIHIKPGWELGFEPGGVPGSEGRVLSAGGWRGAI